MHTLQHLPQTSLKINAIFPTTIFRCFLVLFKVHIFWQGHKILRNLHRRFCEISTVDLSHVVPVKSTVEILWPSQNIWTLGNDKMFRRWSTAEIASIQNWKYDRAFKCTVFSHIGPSLDIFPRAIFEAFFYFL